MRVGLPTGVVEAGVDETITGLWTFANALGFLTDVIGERTGGAGVTVDGVLLRDSAISLLGFVSASNRVFGTDVLGDIDERFRLHAGGIMQWGDGSGARDTDLFRAAADLLATADSFRVAGVLGLVTDIITERTAAAGVTVDDLLIKDGSIRQTVGFAAGTLFVSSGVVGDANNRFRQFIDGSQEWGDGTLARDTNLFRAAADELATDDSFRVGGTLLVDAGLEVAAQETTLAAQANDFDTGGLTVQRFQLTGAQSITGFAAVDAPRLLMIVNRDAGDQLTLVNNSGSSAAANRILLPGAVDLVMPTTSGVILWYDSTSNIWIALA